MELSFYYQLRADGRIRSGLEVDHRLMAQRLEGADVEHDPTLVWYIDLAFETAEQISSPEAAREWLLQRARLLQQSLGEVADELAVGADMDLWPVRRSKQLASGVDLTITISAIRRLPVGELASAVRRLADDFPEIVQSLEIQAPVEW